MLPPKTQHQAQVSYRPEGRYPVIVFREPLRKPTFHLSPLTSHPSPFTSHLITISVMTCAFTWSLSLFTSDLRLMSNS